MVNGAAQLAPGRQLEAIVAGTITIDCNDDASIRDLFMRNVRTSSI
jgi:hypothetical protein